MFKKLNLSFKPIFGFKDQKMDRVQGQINKLVDSLKTIQQDMFLIELPLYSKEFNPIDTLIYSENWTGGTLTGVSTNPADLGPRAVAVGFGREIIGNNVIISTLLHRSPKILLGEQYGLDAETGTFTIDSYDGYNPVITGIAPNIGLIHPSAYPYP